MAKTIKPRKLVAVMDDTPEDGFRAAYAASRIGGHIPIIYDSPSAFLHEYNYSIDQALQRYSAIICDNNFQATSGEWGHEFIQYTLAPALLKIPQENRPTVICFAPSSWEVIREHQQEFEGYGIHSLHKQDQIALIGMALRISAEGIAIPSLEFIREVINATKNQMANLFFTYKLAPEIYDLFEQANSLKAANAMLQDISPCSLTELRSAALENFGPVVRELLDSSLPKEDETTKTEGRI